RTNWLATSVTCTPVRSAARYRMSRITPGQASASTQMCSAGGWSLLVVIGFPYQAVQYTPPWVPPRHSATIGTRNPRLPMLSYRHAFHAGNFADVLKHLVLVNTLRHA